MPTKAEFEELISNCKVVWTTVNGVNGRVFTSKKPGFENKSIFLPAAGSGDYSSLYSAGFNGYYWSSTFYNDNYAWFLIFYSGNDITRNRYRHYGGSIRPVSEY